MLIYIHIYIYMHTHTYIYVMKFQIWKESWDKVIIRSHFIVVSGDLRRL